MNRRGCFVALVLAALSTGAASPQDAPLVTISDLGMAVGEAKVVREIKGLMGNKLSAKAGNKLAVVSLSGKAPGPCRVELRPSEFAAVFAAAAPSAAAGTERAVAGAVGIDGMWMFAEGLEYAQTVTVPKAGPFRLDLAISVPGRVSEFDVQHLGASMGKAVLAAKP